MQIYHKSKIFEFWSRRGENGCYIPKELTNQVRCVVPHLVMPTDDSSFDADLDSRD